METCTSSYSGTPSNQLTYTRTVTGPTALTAAQALTNCGVSTSSVGAENTLFTSSVQISGETSILNQFSAPGGLTSFSAAVRNVDPNGGGGDAVTSFVVYSPSPPPSPPSPPPLPPNLPPPPTPNDCGADLGSLSQSAFDDLNIGGTQVRQMSSNTRSGMRFCMRQFANLGRPRQRTQRKNIVRQMFAQLETQRGNTASGLQSVRTLKVMKEDLDMPAKFKRPKVLLVPPGETVDVSTIEGDTGFHADINENENVKFQLSGTIATFTREDVAVGGVGGVTEERYSMALSAPSPVTECVPCAHFSTTTNTGYFVIDDEFRVGGQKFFIGSFGVQEGCATWPRRPVIR